MKKKIIAFLVFVTFLFPSSAFAFEGTDASAKEIINEQENDSVTRSQFAFRKENVKTYEEWSPYKRVSDNICPDGPGGEISADRTVTFKVEVSGVISGINVIGGGSIASEKHYTLPVEEGRCGYMAFRVKYKVEEGTRVQYDMVTDRVINTNKYKVKVPQYGSYKILYDGSDV